MGNEGWTDYSRLRDQEAATQAAHVLARRALGGIWLRAVGASVGWIAVMALGGLFVTEEGVVYWVLLVGTLLAVPLLTILLTMKGNPIGPALGAVLPGTFIGVFAAALQFRSIDDNGFGGGFLLLAWMVGSILALILASMRAFQRRRTR